MSQEDDDAVLQLAREYVRAFGGEAAAERFEDALEEHGIRKALEEAAIGVSAGLLLTRLQQGEQRERVPSAGGPVVDELPLPEEHQRKGTALRIVDNGPGVPDGVTVREPRAHEDEVTIDGAVMIETARGTYFWDVGFDYEELDHLEEPNNGVAHVAVLEPVEEVDLVAVEDVQEADGAEEEDLEA